MFDLIISEDNISDRLECTINKTFEVEVTDNKLNFINEKFKSLNFKYKINSSSFYLYITSPSQREFKSTELSKDGYSCSKGVFYSDNDFDYKLLTSMFLFKDELEGQFQYKLKTDIPGFDGWNSMEEFFFHLNRNLEWLVLRNYQFLPYNFFGNDHDIDLLCSDRELFVNVANARKRSSGISGYEVKIEGKFIDLDIRFLGDQYYDLNWQKRMLRTRVFSNDIVPIPNDENHFFSLLYHLLLQKKNFTKTSIERLSSILKKGDGFIKNCNERQLLYLLNNYMNENDYEFYLPHDLSLPVNLNYRKLKMKNKKKHNINPSLFKMIKRYLRILILKY
ncbi:hypothetical protein [Vibrio hepatarius]|uniref:hypothetical protein n=1 Tax=Vibrio hepatarius TaxID=171383 RepID=UPI001C08AA1F|nr:hypothetical protein [Vibrio hepatarius]MBU2896908.1 hypothetical protein [Vibrio hepatarius]